MYIDFSSNHKILNFFGRLKCGVDWGPVKFLVRWISDNGRFMIWTCPGSAVWSGIGLPRQYHPVTHYLMDFLKDSSGSVGLSLERETTVRRFEGRLTKIQLEDMIMSAYREERDSPRTNS